MTAVYAFADEKYLYVRIDVAGNPSSDICYSVKLTPAGSSNYVWAHSDVGSPLFVHGLYGMEASTIRDQAVGMGEVVEMAIPREALGESRGIGILVETRRVDEEWEERCDSTKEWILML